MPETEPSAVPPAVTLRDWMTEHGITSRWLVRHCGGSLLAAKFLVDDVLARRPLGERHAAALEQATGISARFWLAREADYRSGLAAGLKDVTPDD
jgi:hypothetical protein